MCMKMIDKIPLKIWTLSLKVLIFVIGLPIFALGAYFMINVINFAFHLWPDLAYIKTIAYVLLSITALLYIYILLKVSYIVHQYEKHKIFSKITKLHLVHASISALFVSIIYALFLPIFYIAAEIDDAPGFVLIGLFVVVLSFGLSILFWVISNIIKQAIELEEENALVV